MTDVTEIANRYKLTWDLLDSLPPDLHNRALCLLDLPDPWLVELAQTEAAQWGRAGEAGQRARLAGIVDTANGKGFDDEAAAAEVLDAVRALDMERVEMLVGAGLRVDRMFRTRSDMVTDLTSEALASFEARVQMYPGAVALWAGRCARLVALLIAHGAPRFVSVPLSGFVASVLACDCLKDAGIKGADAYREVVGEVDTFLEREGDLADRITALLDQRGILTGAVRAFDADEAQARFDRALDNWLEDFGDE